VKKQTVFSEKISYLVKKSLLHIEFIFIDGQKTITKGNTTQQQLNQQQRNQMDLS